MRKSAEREKSEQGVSGIMPDILLLLFTLLGVFFTLSLFSYSHLDPSFSNIVFSRYNDSVQNLFGKTGAYTADLLGTVFGWAALAVPAAFFYISVILYRYKKGLTFFFAPLIAFLYCLCIITCLAALSGLIGGMDPYFYNKPSGGALAVITSSFAVSIVGKVGGIIIAFVLLLVFVMLLFSMSLSDMWHFFRIFGVFLKAVAVRVARLFKRKPRAESAYVGPSAPPVLPDKTAVKSENILNDEELDAIASIDFQLPHERNPKKTEPLDEQLPTVADNQKVSAQGNDDNDEPVFRRYSGAVAVNETADEPKKIEENEVTEPYTEEKIEMREAVEITKKRFLNYNIPLSILSEPDRSAKQESESELKAKGDILLQKLNDFGVTGKIRAIQPGPVVTMYEFIPAPGIRISRIAGLESDLALSMSALSIRIIAPIPGTNAVGVEIPNKNRAGIAIKELFQSPEFAGSSSPLTVALGKDVIGQAFMSDIRKMPHLLVAGTTGSGKSVGINTMICSILYKASPDDVKFIMIDPKMVELSVYEGIPHMLAPVVTDTKLASSVLKNVVAEMTRRYTLLAERKVRNIDGYNEMIAKDGSAEKMYYLVVIVDEFADLMMVSGKDVEVSIARIAQMARAVGIHLIIATQRPTANVITGLIKANMPARLSFKVSQKNDSRIILDQNGADTLLGYGDSLFIPPGKSEPLRIHGAFVSDGEVRDIVEHLKQFGEPEYNLDMVKVADEDAGGEGGGESAEDEKYEEALNIAYKKGTVSISMIQRYLQIGYNRAARIVEMMEERGVVAPSDGTSKPREVIRR